MINLPHKLDVVNVGEIAGVDSTFVFSTPAGATVEAGTYSISGRDLIVSKTDSEGKTIPDDVLQSIQVRLTDDIARTVPKLFIVNISEKNGTFRLFLPFPDVTGSWPLDTGTITLEFLFSGATPNNLARLEGVFKDKIDCFTNQLSRSLDNEYDERYHILTDYIFDETRNLYLVPIDGVDSGLPLAVDSLRIERIQKGNGFSIIIGQAYPKSPTSLSVVFRDFDYTDSGGNEKQINIPIVIE